MNVVDVFQLRFWFSQSVKWVGVFLCLPAVSAHAACDTSTVLRAIFHENSPISSPQMREKLKRIYHSRLVKNAIEDTDSVYNEYYAFLRYYSPKAGRKNVTLNGEVFINGSLSVKNQTLVVYVDSMKLWGMKYGDNPNGISYALHKFIGTVLHGVDQNVARNQFHSVRIVGTDFLNSRLSETMKGFGFTPRQVSIGMGKHDIEWSLEIPLQPLSP